MTRLIDPFTLFPPSGPPPVGSELNNDLLVYYRFEDNLDELNGWNLTNVNNVTFVPGVVLNGTDHSGSSGAMLKTAPDATPFYMSSNKTFFIWARISSGGNNAVCGNSNGGGWYLQRRSSDVLRLNAPDTLLDIAFTAGQWDLWTVRVTGTTWEMRRDKGAWSSLTSSWSPPNAGTEWAFGVLYGDFPFGSFGGNLDECAIYDKALSDALCDEYYDQGMAGHSYPFPAL